MLKHEQHAVHPNSAHWGLALLKSGIPPAVCFWCCSMPCTGVKRTSRGYAALLFLSTFSTITWRCVFCKALHMACSICVGCCVERVQTCFCTRIRICPGSLLLCTDNFVRVMLPGDLTEQELHIPENTLETASHLQSLSLKINILSKTCLSPRATGSVLSSSISITHLLQRLASAFDFLCGTYWKETG